MTKTLPFRCLIGIGEFQRQNRAIFEPWRLLHSQHASEGLHFEMNCTVDAKWISDEISRMIFEEPSQVRPHGTCRPGASTRNCHVLFPCELIPRACFRLFDESGMAKNTSLVAELSSVIAALATTQPLAAPALRIAVIVAQQCTQQWSARIPPSVATVVVITVRIVETA